MEDKKSTRIPNFSPAEKENLMMIAMRYSKILEDKKTNRTGLEEKAKAWKAVETEFNNTAPILAFRSQEQLKRLYENKKKDLRKKFANQKKETYLTGGGPAPKDIQLDRVDNLLSQILNEKSVKGFYSEFDCDNLDQQNNITNKNFEPNMKKQKTEQHGLTGGDYKNQEKDVEIYEFVPLEETENKIIATDDNLLIPDQEFEYQSNRCPPTVLQKPINSKLLPNIEAPSTSKTVNTSSGETKTLRSDRRRPVGGLRALTSSDVGEKYNILLDKRLVLVEKQLEQIIQSKTFAQEEHKQKIKILRLEEENLRLEKEEKLLKVELLKTKIQLERI